MAMSDQRFTRAMIPESSAFFIKSFEAWSSIHDLESAGPEARVWADVLKYRLPEGLMTNLLSEHRLPDTFSYQYRRVDDVALSAIWRKFLAAFWRKLRSCKSSWR
jgi:hypothetical protein